MGLIYSPNASLFGQNLRNYFPEENKEAPLKGDGRCIRNRTNGCVCVCVCVCVCMCNVHKEIYCKELTHVIMEADKF